MQHGTEMLSFLVVHAAQHRILANLLGGHEALNRSITHFLGTLHCTEISRHWFQHAAQHRTLAGLFLVRCAAPRSRQFVGARCTAENSCKFWGHGGHNRTLANLFWHAAHHRRFANFWAGHAGQHRTRPNLCEQAALHRTIANCCLARCHAQNSRPCFEERCAPKSFQVVFWHAAQRSALANFGGTRCKAQNSRQFWGAPPKSRLVFLARWTAQRTPQYVFACTLHKEGLPVAFGRQAAHITEPWRFVCKHVAQHRFPAMRFGGTPHSTELSPFVLSTLHSTAVSHICLHAAL